MDHLTTGGDKTPRGGRITGAEQGRENGVTEGETGGSPIALPAGLLIDEVEPASSRERPPWLAMLAAALLHALAVLWIVVDWSHPATLPKEPVIVPVRVVLAPPAPPPPPPVPVPTPAPKPASPSLAYRESGPDQRTTAPPPAETKAPEAAAPPPPAPEVPRPEKEAPPPPPQEKPIPPEKQPAPQDSAKPLPNKEVARTRAVEERGRTAAGGALGTAATSQRRAGGAF